MDLKFVDLAGLQEYDKKVKEALDKKVDKDELKEALVEKVDRDELNDIIDKEELDKKIDKEELSKVIDINENNNDVKLGTKGGKLVLRDNGGNWKSSIQHSVPENPNAEEQVLFANSNGQIGWMFGHKYEKDGVEYNLNPTDNIDWNTTKIIPDMHIRNNKVGINKILDPNSNYELDVNGKINAKEIYVNEKLIQPMTQEEKDKLDNLKTLNTYIRESGNKDIIYLTLCGNTIANCYFGSASYLCLGDGSTNAVFKMVNVNALNIDGVETQPFTQEEKEAIKKWTPVINNLVDNNVLSLGEKDGMIVVRTNASGKWSSSIQSSVVDGVDDEYVLFTNSNERIGWIFASKDKDGNSSVQPIYLKNNH